MQQGESVELPKTWTNSAACVDAPDLDIFFVDERHTKTIEEAKRYCKVCPVKKTCLLFGLTFPNDPGIFGGTTLEERKRMKVLMPDLEHQLTSDLGLSKSA